MCNVIGLDKKHDDVIIHAGNNEIANTESLPEFVYTVSKTAEKLKKISSDTNVTMVLPCAPTTGPHEIAKAEYFEEKIREIDDIKVVKVDNIEYDGTHHPTEKGTAQIIEQIQAAVEEKIVLDGAESETTTARKYSLVQPVYKIGCRGCDTREYTPDLCLSCKEEAQTSDIQYLTELIEKVEIDLYPKGMLGLMEDDVEMKNCNKRGRDRNDEIGDNFNNKNARN